MARVYVGIGSNIDRAANVRAAIDRLREAFRPLLVSTIYDTPPFGFSGDDFYNLVIGFDTDIPPTEVDAILRRIEATQGRDRTADSYAARTLDLDLLLYGDIVTATAGLRLPRADVERFAFVLGPLAEIAPAERHPVTGKTYLQMWQEFDPVAKSTLKAVSRVE